MSDTAPSAEMPATVAEAAAASSPSAQTPASTAVAAAMANIPTHDAQGQPLSKNAIKKLRKQAHFDALKPLRRAKEKELRKAKKVEKKRIAQESCDAGGGAGDGAELGAPPSKRPKRENGGKIEPFGARIVIDCGFDELMIDKEIKSMASQLAYCYSSNKSSSRPFDLLITSFNARLKAKFDAIKGHPHENWRGVEWWQDSWDGLWADELVSAPDNPSTTDPAPVASTSTSTSTPTSSETLKRASCSKLSIVYLTGDSPNILSTLTPGETYVLGGIVDHNRYKNLCLERAEKAGVRHAQLPIGQFMPALRTRKVLTVNQVYDILVNFVSTNSWQLALEAVMPQRKLAEGAQGQPAATGSAVGSQKAIDGIAEGDADATAEGQGVYVVQESDVDDEFGGASC